MLALEDIAALAAEGEWRGGHAPAGDEGSASMTSGNALHWCLALSAVTISQLMIATALILIPQWRIQQTAHQGVVSFLVASDGSVRLWNRPIANAAIPRLLASAEQINPDTRIRVILDPDVRWGTARNLLGQFQGTSLQVDFQLPEIERQRSR